MILIAAEIFGAVLVNRVIALAVTIRIIEVINLQGPVLSDKWHRIADIGVFRGGVQPVSHRFIGFVRRESRYPTKGEQQRQHENGDHDPCTIPHKRTSFPGKNGRADFIWD